MSDRARPVVVGIDPASADLRALDLAGVLVRLPEVVALYGQVLAELRRREIVRSDRSSRYAAGTARTERVT